MSTQDIASCDIGALLLESARLSRAAREVLERFEGDARQLLDAFCNLGLHADAITVIARVLPRPLGLAWACECIRRLPVLNAKTHAADRAGLALAEGWLRNPTEENRRAALDFAEFGKFDGVGAWIAAAVGWTGGSIAPVGYTPVSPGKYLTADAVATALCFLAAQESGKISQREAFCVTAARNRFVRLSRPEGAALLVESHT